MISLTDKLSTSFSQYRCYMFNSVNHLCLILLTCLSPSVADTLRYTLHPDPCTTLPTGPPKANSLPSWPEGILWSLVPSQLEGTVGKKCQGLSSPGGNPRLPA